MKFCDYEKKNNNANLSLNQARTFLKTQARTRPEPEPNPKIPARFTTLILRISITIDQLFYNQIFQNYLKKLCIIDCTHF